MEEKKAEKSLQSGGFYDLLFHDEIVLHFLVLHLFQFSNVDFSWLGYFDRVEKTLPAVPSDSALLPTLE